MKVALLDYHQDFTMRLPQEPHHIIKNLLNHHDFDACKKMNPHQEIDFLLELELLRYIVVD